MRAESAILRDAKRAPRLFVWFGGLSPEAMREWLKSSGLPLEAIPGDLRALWEATGGGDYFESETLLGPSGDPELGDEVISANRWLREQGMPGYFVAFARGVWTGAVDTRTGRYVVLSDDGTWAAREAFDSFDEWYLKTARSEFASRYGLPRGGE